MNIIKIIKRKDIYDVYDENSGKWLFSRRSAYNVLTELSKFEPFHLIFVDEITVLL